MTPRVTEAEVKAAVAPAYTFDQLARKLNVCPALQKRMYFEPVVKPKKLKRLRFLTGNNFRIGIEQHEIRNGGELRQRKMLRVAALAILPRITAHKNKPFLDERFELGRLQHLEHALGPDAPVTAKLDQNFLVCVAGLDQRAIQIGGQVHVFIENHRLFTLEKSSP
jgi:hypothetical protein